MLWLLVLAVPLVLVVFDWWIDSELGSAEIDEQRRAARDDVGQVVETRDDALTITGPGPDQVVLTFDDGPDPRWTPQVLDVLAQHDVPATFFVVGKRVVDHPSLTRRIWDEGHELANHTFTHPDVASEHPWRQRFEVALTDRVIAGATGRQSTMYRLPFSSEAAQISPGELEVLHRFDDRLAVFSDGFTRDYLATDAADILDDVPALDASGGLVLLLHDGGGDRSATVAALDQLIPELRARGMEFVSLSEALGVDRDAVNPPAGRFERWSGTAVVELLQLAGVLRVVLRYIAYALLCWAIVKVILDIVLALAHRRRMRRRVVALDHTPTVSIIVPAYNEAESISDALRTILASNYPVTEVIVVDDGSSDGTADVARSLASGRVRVIEQANAGKASALNRGVRAAVGEIVVCVDADTVFQHDTVTWIVQPFVDPSVGAVSGNVKVGNRRSLLGKWQHVEYSYGQQMERRAQELLGVTWCIPGAIGAFRRHALLDAGGFSTDTMAEDTDTAVKVHLGGWASVFEPRSIAWTEVPTSVRPLWRQRIRWHFGNYQVLWKQKSQLFKRPRRFGLLMLPYTFLSLVAMPLVLPIIDILAIVKIATNGVGAVVYLWLGLGALTFGSAWFAMRLNGESPKALVHLPLQQVVYRCGYVVLSLKALRMAVAGALLAWNKPPRRGEAGDALGTSTHLPDTDGHVVDEPAGSPVDIGVGVGTPEARTA